MALLAVALTVGVAGSAMAMGVFGSRNPDRWVVDARTQAERQYNMPFEPGIGSSGGNLIWFGGTNAMPLYHEHPHDPEVVAAVPDDAYQQSLITLRQIERVLTKGCARWTDVVRLDVFLVSPEDIAGYGRAAGEVMGPSFPRRPDYGHASGTLAYVKALDEPNLKIEISGVAVVPKSRKC